MIITSHTNDINDRDDNATTNNGEKKEEAMMMANAQTILAVIRIMMIDIKHNTASTDLLVTCAHVSVVGLGQGARFAVGCPFAALAVR